MVNHTIGIDGSFRTAKRFKGQLSIEPRNLLCANINLTALLGGWV